MTGSIRAYARSRKERGLTGGSDTAVRKAIARRRVVPLSDGSIDFDAADAGWGALDAVPTETAGKAAPRADRMRPTEPVREQPPAARHAPVDPDRDSDSFMSARTRRERAEAERAERRNRVEAKELLEAADVRSTLQQIGKIYAGARGTVPAQLATQLVGLTDLNELERIIRVALVEADTRICVELGGRFPDLVDGDSNNGDGSSS